MVVGVAIGQAVANSAYILAQGALTQAMDKLKDTVRDSIAFAENAQKASLALGLTFQQTNEKLGPTLEGLRGDINERFAAGIAGMEAGLQGNTAGIARLINQQRLTGTQSRQTAKVFAGMEAALGLSREQTNNLAASLVETGEDWQISTDHLVNAMDALKDTFAAQDLAGMGVKTTDAFKTITAEMGPQLKKPLESVMKMILDTSFKGMEKLTMLGIGGVREQLSASKSSEESAKILKAAFITASKKFKEIAGGSDKAYFLLGAAAELFGPAAINFTLVAKNLGIRMKEEQKEVDKFALTLSTLVSEILLPIKQALAESIYPALIKVAPFLHKLLIGVANWIRVTLNILDPVFRELVEWGKAIADSFEWIAFTVGWSTHLGIVVPFQTMRITMWLIDGAFITLYTGILQLVKGLVWAYNKIRSVFTLGLSTDTGTAGIDSQLAWAEGRLERGSQNISEAFGTIFSDPMKRYTDALANTDKNKLGNMLLGDIVDNMEKGFEVAMNTEKNTRDTADALAPETSEYLSETANVLGRSIEAILGVGRDTTAEEMLEELRVANEQREAAIKASIIEDLKTKQTSGP